MFNWFYLCVQTIAMTFFRHKYTVEETEILETLEVHEKACRNIEFSKDGKILFSSSKDKSIALSDVKTGKLKQFYENAHE